ncbi:DoxX family protein [Agromyces sp. MMS17-SY077]|uniref:DoxX family protein n=1 Tax=Agromyces seonyuensis TaxID=2662446 RepID=A0A6I4NXK2_9MICO|nr:DoxX family protein [Agromyces seonyuensis]
MGPVPIALVAGTAITALAGLAGLTVAQGWQAALTVGLALMFLLTASARFGRRRGELVAMVPPVFPFPTAIVVVTGILEALGAIGLLVPATHRAAAICLALLLVAVFPANVHAARSGAGMDGKPPTPLGLRTLEQAVYLGALIAVALG